MSFGVLKYFACHLALSSLFNRISLGTITDFRVRAWKTGISLMVTGKSGIVRKLIKFRENCENELA